MLVSYVSHKALIIWPTKNNFPHFLMALLSDLDRLLLKEYHTILTALTALTRYNPYSLYSPYTLTQRKQRK